MNVNPYLSTFETHMASRCVTDVVGPSNLLVGALKLTVLYITVR